MSVRYEIQTRYEAKNKATVSRKLHIYCHNERELPTIDFHSDAPFT